MKILLVEDDGEIAAFVNSGLTAEGFSVDWAADGASGKELGVSRPYDAAVVDVMLPALDGLTLIQELRTAAVWFPVLILSAKHSVDDRVTGLTVGGDDYLTKPFAMSELLARLRALLRRVGASSSPTEVRVKDLRLDLLTREVWRADVRCDLQPREFELLRYLVENKGRVVTRAAIIRDVWKYNFDPQTNIVEARMCKLREKLEPEGSEPLIQTIRGVGYVVGGQE